MVDLDIIIKDHIFQISPKELYIIKLRASENTASSKVIGSSHCHFFSSTLDSDIVNERKLLPSHNIPLIKS